MNFAILNCACLILTLYSMLKPLETLQNYSMYPYVSPKKINTVLQFSCSCSPGEIDQTSPCEFLLWCVSHSLVAVARELFPWHFGEENIRRDEVGDWSVRMVIVVLSLTMFLLDTFGFIFFFSPANSTQVLWIVGFQVWLFLARCSHTPPPRPRCHRGTLLHVAWKWKNLIRRGDDMVVDIWWLWWYGFFVIPPLHHPYHRRSPCDARSLYFFSSQSCGNTH